MKYLIFAILFLSSAFSFSQQVTPYKGSRIFWDFDSQKTAILGGNYARMIELQDGRLLMVAETLGGIGISFSSNQGSVWSTPILIASPPDNVSYAVPDVIQLTNGTILVGFNPRPKSPYSSERLFGIRVIRSTDNGKTWSDPIFIYDADYIFSNGCWEPSFLELPSGEVQCYFANEDPYTSNSDQEISMCRSYDKGLTWSTYTTVSYRSGSRDGMPVPLLLQDSTEIAVIIEDNGWSGRTSFTATTVRNSLAENWTNYVNASSSNRAMIYETIPSTSIISSAPYIRKLPNGETVASYQTNENRISNDLQYYDMQVMVGDKQAKNFKAKSNPFALGNDKHAIWNSVSVIDTGIVVAVASIGIPNGANDVVMIKGYPKKQADAKYGTITVDGINNSDENWTTSKAAQLFLGASTGNKVKVDFLYDDNYLYITSLIVDRTLINSGTDNDGLLFLIDADNVSSTTPRVGMYSFFFDTNGTVKLKRGNSGSWYTDTNTSGILYSVNLSSFYYNIEAAIPWSLLGKTSPPVGERMAIAVENIDKQQYSIKYNSIADVDNDASWTWLNFFLAPNQNTVVKQSKHNNSDVITYVNKGFLYVKSLNIIKELSLFSFNGALIEKKYMGLNFQIPLLSHRGVILKLIFEDETILQRKLLL